MPRRRKAASRLVSFRLPEALASRLETEAAKQGMSIGESARALLASTLQDENRLRVLQEVGELRMEVLRLRDNMATAIEHVLLNVLPKADPANIRKWVGENLRR